MMGNNLLTFKDLQCKVVREICTQKDHMVKVTFKII